MFMYLGSFATEYLAKETFEKIIFDEILTNILSFIL